MEKISHFFFLSLFCFLFSFSLYFFQKPLFLDQTFWLNLTFLFALFLLFEIFLFFISSAQKKASQFKTPLAIYLFFSLILICILFLKPEYLKIFSPQLIIFFLFLFLFFSGFGLIFFAKLLKTSYLENIAFSILFIFFILLLTTINLFIPIFFGDRYFWLNFLSAFFFIIFLFFFFRKIKAEKILLYFVFFLIVSILIGQIHFFHRSRFLNLALLFLFLPFAIFLINSKVKEEKTIGEIEKIAREKEELLRVKDQFILSLQHHLRTPFTPLREYLERILEGIYGRIENPIVKEKLFEMKKLSDTLGSLMEDLLDIQQIKMGKEILTLEECQIERIIDGIIEEIKPEAEKKGLYLNFSKTPLPKMRLDKRRIREALFNLLDNAIKYTKRGGIEIKTSLVNKRCRILISDTGIGMSKDEIERFMEGKIFERGEMAKRFYGPGRGIGLAIAIEFIKAHGGKIRAKSEGWGKGTTFYVELPIKS